MQPKWYRTFRLWPVITLDGYKMGWLEKRWIPAYDHVFRDHGRWVYRQIPNFS